MFFLPTSCFGDLGSTASSTGTSTASAGGTSWLFIIALVVMFAVMIIPQRRRQKKVQDMLSAIKSGDRIKTIGGFIPICSNCKKIRDENGSWSSIDRYIMDYTEHELSHGICPECSEMLYGPFFKS